MLRALDGLGRARAPDRAHRDDHRCWLEVFGGCRSPRSMQPTHCTLYTRADGATTGPRLGERRAGLPVPRPGRAGARLALGSDWPVAPYDPRGVLADAQLRRPHDGPDAISVARQALRRDEALD